MQKQDKNGIGHGFTQLLETEMTRHEFLRYMVAVAFGVFGITNLLNTLRHTGTNHTKSNGGGYGYGAYGR